MRALGIPVFVHPITDPTMHKRFGQTGRQGTRFARAAINSMALISLLEGASMMNCRTCASS